MSSKLYRVQNSSYVATNTDILDDLPQRRAREELIPIIAKKARNATNVIPVWIEYFQRLKSGRRCSCWTVEEDPQGLCQVCMGSGIVGGFNKRGTRTISIDATYPNVSGANVEVDYTHPSRPYCYSLLPTAVYGTMEFTIPITQNVGILDVLQINDYQPPGTKIEYLIKLPLEADYVTLTEENLQNRLHNDTIQVKIIFKRHTPEAPLPKLQNIRISYKLLRITAVRADTPRVTESMTLEEFGIIESWTTVHFYLDNTIKNINNEDFVVNLQDSTRWKVIDYSDNKPLGLLTSWDITCRKIQDTETYMKIPIGVQDTCALPPYQIRSAQTDAELLNQGKEKSSNNIKTPGHRGDVTVVYSDSDGTDAVDPLREE